jgi:hypothetical protein
VLEERQHALKSNIVRKNKTRSPWLNTRPIGNNPCVSALKNNPRSVVSAK